MEVVTITILIIFGIFIILKLPTRYWRRNKLPPGPWNLPIIGSIHHFRTDSLSAPHITLKKLSKTYGPLMHIKVGQLNIIIASSPETAKAIMKTHDLAFATRPLLEAVKILHYGGKDLAFTPYGEYWRHLRKICVLELLSGKSVSSFSPLRHQEIHDLLCLLSSSSSSSSSYGTLINVSERIKSCINNITVGATLGGKWLKDDQMMFLNALNEALDVAAGINLHDLFPSFSWFVAFFSGSRAKVEVCHRRLDDVAERILQKHRLKEATRKEETEDFVDLLLKLQRDDTLQFQLKDDCIKAIAGDMIGGGSETSSTMILWAMSELMRNPAAMEKAQKEIRETFMEEPVITETKMGEAKYLQLVIKETLRLHPPVPLLPRECRETSNVLGYEIPQGTKAMVNVWAIGRDPNYWEDPEEFKPERFEGSAWDFKGNNFEFLPFGSGRRMCPGILFGIASVELVLANLLHYFDWKLPEGVRCDELDMTEQFGATIRRKSDLCLRLKVAIPLPE